MDVNEQTAFAGALLNALNNSGIFLTEREEDTLHKLAQHPHFDFIDSFTVVGWILQAHSKGILRVTDKIIEEREKWRDEPEFDNEEYI